MAAGCACWGVVPLLYKALDQVDAVEVLMHRVIWSSVFFAIVLAFQQRLREVPTLFVERRERWIILMATLMVAVNWGIFIYSVQSGRALEASLGYFIFPLVSVLLGVFILREAISPRQGLAIGVAAMGVLVLITGAGVVPVLGLVLAVTFGLYGLLKNQVEAGPVLSVSAECLIMLPVALVWLALFNEEGQFGIAPWETFLMVASGPATAIPLVLFSYGAKRVSMGLTGLMFYINPILQFLVAVFLFSEPFTLWHGIAFGFIWAAITIYLTAPKRGKGAA
ncbi:EamA-like transporter family protein [Roseovarius albus]|uniref:EamA-like transporter family protein n=1 Tax=Roseovarius albus TaxID=1247867 RepID=A0A1X7A165_9RHOB|nr:EamA-like transporter family protein [Roseovarius albus]